MPGRKLVLYRAGRRRLSAVARVTVLTILLVSMSGLGCRRHTGRLRCSRDADCGTKSVCYIDDRCVPRNVARRMGANIGEECVVQNGTEYGCEDDVLCRMGRCECLRQRLLVARTGVGECTSNRVGRRSDRPSSAVPCRMICCIGLLKTEFEWKVLMVSADHGFSRFPMGAGESIVSRRMASAAKIGIKASSVR